MFKEYIPTKEKKASPEARRSLASKASIKVKRGNISVGFSRKFLEDNNLTFDGGVGIWFDEENKLIKFAPKTDSSIFGSVTETGFQSISIGRILRRFGFKINKSFFNVDIKKEKNSVIINLTDYLVNQEE